MENYRITIDSNSDLPSFLAEKYQTVIIPQYYAFGDEVYGDEKNMTPAEFYQKMREGALPSSMANNPAVIRERFEGILKEGFDILHIAFSSALSGSYNNVCVAAQELMEEYPDRKIVVVDSLNVSLAETILSLCTAQEETEHGTVYDGTALQPYLYQCSEVTEVVSSMDRPMHLNVSYKTQDDIEASLEIDYDVIVLRSVYYPEEDAYALEQMGKAVWMTHFRYGS